MEVSLGSWKCGAAAVNSVFRKYEHDWSPVSIITVMFTTGIPKNFNLNLSKGKCSQLSPCGHVVITDTPITWSGQQLNSRQK